MKKLLFFLLLNPFFCFSQFSIIVYDSENKNILKDYTVKIDNVVCQPKEGNYYSKKETFSIEISKADYITYHSANYSAMPLSFNNKFPLTKNETVLNKYKIKKSTYKTKDKNEIESQLNVKDKIKIIIEKDSAWICNKFNSRSVTIECYEEVRIATCFDNWYITKIKLPKFPDSNLFTDSSFQVNVNEFYFKIYDSLNIELIPYQTNIVNGYIPLQKDIIDTTCYIGEFYLDKSMYQKMQHKNINKYYVKFYFNQYGTYKYIDKIWFNLPYKNK